ncbi:MAG: Ldh family oxidoreductase, partial [Pseudoalteromonas tetraodonis]
PHGALKSLFGTNPICFGTPTGSKVPFILDTSISMINRGKIRVAARNNQKIPEGVALDNKGIPWGIMTNKPGFLTDPLVRAIPALKSAQIVISGDTLAESKPSPLPLLHCAEQMSVDPSRCLYIGDAQRDIQAGKAANMHTATALWGYVPSVDEALAWNADFNWHSPIDAFNHI